MQYCLKKSVKIEIPSQITEVKSWEIQLTTVKETVQIFTYIWKVLFSAP